jgi:molybdenum cofactor cytidylyltransferase
MLVSASRARWAKLLEAAKGDVKDLPITGVVLAAGDGERMRGSKALLLIGGQPLATAHARRLREAGCARVVVVVRQEVKGKLSAEGGVELVSSSAADPAGSLARAVQSWRCVPGALVVITPVDSAPVRPATIARILAALSPGVDAATPEYDGKGGHPIACRASVLDPYLGTTTPPPLRDVLRALGNRRVRVPVDDPHVLIDLDTPDDVVTFTGHPPRFVR